MKGQIPTPALMRAVLDKESGLRSGKTIGQVVLMEIKKDRRTFLMTDTGVTVDPTLEQKQDLIESAVRISRKLGAASPRIAIMSATEKVNESLPDTLVADQLAKLSKRGIFDECVVEGPLSFDLAYATDAGEKKGVSGQVTGNADAMVFPRSPLSEPDSEGNHVHGRLPIWRDSHGDDTPGRLYVASRCCPDPPQFDRLCDTDPLIVKPRNFQQRHSYARSRSTCQFCSGHRQ